MEASSIAVYELSQISQRTRLSATSVLIDPEASDNAELQIHEQRLMDEPTTLVDTQTTPVKSPTALSQPSAGANAQFWKVFGSTFITIFLAELGDKTQVATLLMSAQSHAPWSVFGGAALALITTSLLGVLVGQWLSSRVSPRTLDIAAGITLALLSIAMLWDVVGL